jgi:hypothetical protein
MALTPEDRQALWEAIYGVVMGYEHGHITLDEAKAMIEMIARGVARA